jgi:CTP:phosphocholine cytidylyltransferase-like protein
MKNGKGESNLWKRKITKILKHNFFVITYINGTYDDEKFPILKKKFNFISQKYSTWKNYLQLLHGLQVLEDCWLVVMRDGVATLTLGDNFGQMSSTGLKVIWE